MTKLLIIKIFYLYIIINIYKRWYLNKNNVLIKNILKYFINYIKI